MSSSTTVNYINIPHVEQPVADPLVRHHAVNLWQFLAIVVQFGLIVTALGYWQLESPLVSRLMQVSFAGFIIHHFLPLRFRLPFFAGLSVVAAMTAVGHFGPNVLAGWLGGTMTNSNFLYHLVPGVSLVLIGFTLIGLCHLPIRFWLRVALVGVTGAALTLLRANSRLFPDISDRCLDEIF